MFQDWRQGKRNSSTPPDYCWVWSNPWRDQEDIGWWCFFWSSQIHTGDSLDHTCIFFFLLYPKFWEFSLTVFFFFYSFILGSNCFASMGCPCCAPKAWCLGVRQSECPSTCCWGVACCWVSSFQGGTCWWRVSQSIDLTLAFNWVLSISCSVLACFDFDNVSRSDNAAPMATSCLNWTLNHSVHLSLAQLFQSTLVTVLSSSTATFQLSCSMTRKACTPCLHFSRCTVTRGRYAWYSIQVPAFKVTPRITCINESLNSKILICLDQTSGYKQLMVLLGSCNVW